MKASCTVEVKGHIIDSLTLPKIMDIIIDSGADYYIDEINIGKEKTKTSYAKLTIQADNQDMLDKILEQLVKHGAVPVEKENVTLDICPHGNTLPDDFYLTNNTPVEIFYKNQWISVDNQAMNCAIVVDELNNKAFCTRLNLIKQGDKVVVGNKGIKNKTSNPQVSGNIQLHQSKSTIIKNIAKRIKEIKANNEGKLLFILDSSFASIKAKESFSKLVENGYVDNVIAANSFAANDIEVNLFETFHGISLKDGMPIDHGYSSNLRAINKINQEGSIKNAVDAKVLKSGIMYSCIKNNVDFTLIGSIKDELFLPEAIKDLTLAQRELENKVKDVKMAVIMAANSLSFRVETILPTEIETVCVDTNSAIVAKLTDRRILKSVGLVIDIETFLKELVDYLG